MGWSDFQLDIPFTAEQRRVIEAALLQEALNSPLAKGSNALEMLSHLFPTVQATNLDDPTRADEVLFWLLESPLWGEALEGPENQLTRYTGWDYVALARVARFAATLAHIPITAQVPTEGQVLAWNPNAIPINPANPADPQPGAWVPVTVGDGGEVVVPCVNQGVMEIEVEIRSVPPEPPPYATDYLWMTASHPTGGPLTITDGWLITYDQGLLYPDAVSAPPPEVPADDDPAWEQAVDIGEFNLTMAAYITFGHTLYPGGYPAPVVHCGRFSVSSVYGAVGDVFFRQSPTDPLELWWGFRQIGQVEIDWYQITFAEGETTTVFELPWHNCDESENPAALWGIGQWDSGEWN